MTHDEIEALLGAYALDAASLEEREEIDAHLADCPRCRAEALAHRETAAMLATGLGEEAPDGLWERVAAATFASRPAEGAVPAPRLGPVPDSRRVRRRELLATRGVRRVTVAVGAAAACAVLALASYLGVEVGQLRTQVHGLDQRVAAAGIAQAAASATVGPHKMITLAAAHGTATATVVLTPSGAAYWLPSTLSGLPHDRTYQLWGLVDNKPVSLGLIGANPQLTSAFRVEAGTTELMVTVEPTGGVPLPTTAVLIAGTVPIGALR